MAVEVMGQVFLLKTTRGNARASIRTVAWSHLKLKSHILTGAAWLDEEEGWR